MNATRSLQQALREISRDDESLVHPTYGRIDRAMRIVGLTWAQWGQLAASAIVAWLLAKVLPLPDPYNLSVALTIAGIPAACALVTMHDDFDVIDWLRAVVFWRRRAGVLLPGTDPDRDPEGYVVCDDAPAGRELRTSRPATRPEDLWT